MFIAIKKGYVIEITYPFLCFTLERDGFHISYCEISTFIVLPVGVMYQFSFVPRVDPH